GSPFVRVPVLSKAIASISANCGRQVLPFESTPFLARLEVVDKVTDTVAAAKAHGEAATKRTNPLYILCAHVQSNRAGANNTNRGIAIKTTVTYFGSNFWIILAAFV